MLICIQLLLLFHQNVNTFEFHHPLPVDTAVFMLLLLEEVVVVVEVRLLSFGGSPSWEGE